MEEASGSIPDVSTVYVFVLFFLAGFLLGIGGLEIGSFLAGGSTPGQQAGLLGV
jgi:hypothetical protein